MIRRARLSSSLLLLAAPLLGCGDATSQDVLAPEYQARYASAGAPVHSVTGSGLVKLYPGFFYRQQVSAFLAADGTARGTIVSAPMDMSAFGIEGSATLVQDVRCMFVAGNTAWLGTVIVKSNHPAFPVGETAVTWVVDQGAGGKDIMYGGPSAFWDPDDLICRGTMPALPATPVSGGNFVVK